MDQLEEIINNILERAKIEGNIPVEAVKETLDRFADSYFDMKTDDEREGSENAAINFIYTVFAGDVLMSETYEVYYRKKMSEIIKNL